MLMDLFPSLQQSRLKHEKYSKDKSSRRLDKQTDRKDFIGSAHFLPICSSFRLRKLVIS
jgi:hypothetical protein